MAVRDSTLLEEAAGPRRAEAVASLRQQRQIGHDDVDATRCREFEIATLDRRFGPASLIPSWRRIGPHFSPLLR
jgi:hypothetical protein